MAAKLKEQHSSPAEQRLSRVTEVGRAMYGTQWQRALSQALGVADRTVRRWVARVNAPPEDISDRLNKILGAKIAELHRLIGWPGDGP